MMFIIEGPPRTKKNHGRRIKRGKRIYSVPSAAYSLWEGKAIWQLWNQWHRNAITQKVSVKALIYREKNTGDLVGYLQAIGDALQKSTVIEDDKLIASWDGSELKKDPKRPRVELELEVTE